MCSFERKLSHQDMRNAKLGVGGGGGGGAVGGEDK